MEICRQMSTGGGEGRSNIKMKKKKVYPSNKSVHLLGRVASHEGKLKVKLNGPQYLDHFLKMHTKVGDDVLMVVTAKRPKRSQAQNNFFFVYLDLISLSCGHSVEELHRWVNGFILGQGITEVFGQKVRMVGSTSGLNISEFCEMMNRIFEETDIPIPDPGPFNLPLTYDEFGKLKLKQEATYRKMKNRLMNKKI